MVKNYLKIGVRSLLRQKIYSFINILGLAVGIAGFIFIMLYVKNELSYDRFFADNDRIFRMVLERIYPNHTTFYATIPQSFEEAAARDFAEIELSTNAFGIPNLTFSHKDEKGEETKFDEEIVLAVDSTFLYVFDFPLLKGDSKTALQKPNEVVITEEFAKRYFKDEDPLGKTIQAAQQEFKVVGVCANVPAHSHFNFSALLSVSTFPFSRVEQFTSFSSFTYFKLRQDVDYKVLESKFSQLVDRYAAAQIERDLGKSWEDYKKEGNGYRYFLQPLTGIHLDNTYFEAQMKPTGSITTVYVLIAVAVLLLLIACINFMNLATARSAERAKEVGVRKVLGSFRPQLVYQFLAESFILTIIGVLLALFIVFVLIPYFNEVAGKQLSLSFTAESVTVLLLLVGFVGLLAGMYPAFVLSSFNPVVVMKGNFTSSQSGKWIRNGLVIFQFWISIILIIGTLVIGSQMRYMRQKNLGFDKEQVLLVERAFNLNPQQSKTLVNEIRSLPEVVQAAGSFASPGQEGDFFGIQFQPEGSSEILTTKSMVVADQLCETLGLTLKEGRWFSESVNDSLSVILNEKTVRVLGLEEPIGSKLKSNIDGPNGPRPVMFTIIGVVKDFNFISLREEITPLVIQSNELFGGGMQYVVARVKGGAVQQAIQSVEAKWNSIATGQPFKFSFLDENLSKQYHAEQQTGKLFSVFSALAVFVACIGLFALSAYITSLRTKEIGVRKVLGASVASVVFLLSKDFTRMILVAFILAVPFAWYVMENWWLQNFAYRIQISVWIFLVAGGMALLIAWITVSYQAIQAAIKDPVKSLRYE